MGYQNATVEELKRRKAVAEVMIAELKALEALEAQGSVPEISVIDRDGKPVEKAFMGIDFGGDGRLSICVRVLDLPETVDRISELEAERDAAVARADVADYTREALAAKCMALEAQLSR